MLIKPKKNHTKHDLWQALVGKVPQLVERSGMLPEVFVNDITYIKSRERTHYLSLITDAYSRMFMGYHFSDDMGAEHVWLKH